MEGKAETEDRGRGRGDEHQEKETEIVVNGRARTVQGKTIDFEEVVALAFPGTHPDPNVVFSMTFQGAAQSPSSGELGPGGSVKIRKGTRFNVTKTTKS